MVSTGDDPYAGTTTECIAGRPLRRVSVAGDERVRAHPKTNGNAKQRLFIIRDIIKNVFNILYGYLYNITISNFIGCRCAWASQVRPPFDEWMADEHENGGPAKSEAKM